MTKQIKVEGTSYQASINKTYAKIVSRLGEPTSRGDEHKIDVSWEIQVGDVVATIYNYKDGTPTEKIRDWQIGGNDHRAVDLVYSILGK